MTTNSQIFVNLPVKDLPKSRAFFESLGYSFNPQFSNDQGACMVVSDSIYVMLLTVPFFQTFTQKPVVDGSKSTQMLICLACESRAEVDSLVEKVLKAGGTAPDAPKDHGFMYFRSYADLDGHQWELMYMDPNAPPPNA